MAAGGAAPVARDTLFRVMSMTEPVTAAAAMILVEECQLRLDEPVDRLLPELSGRRVLKRLDGPVEDTVPTDRPITVRDLLTFPMGGYGGILAPPGTYPIQAALEVLSLARPDPPGPDEWIGRLGTLPLIHQPGQRWMYSTGADVLGVLIPAPPASRWRPSCASGSSSRSACTTPASPCPPPTSGGWPPPTGPTRPPAPWPR
jgi:CubicO group peptidase (beta-lactamase class C family)